MAQKKAKTYVQPLVNVPQLNLFNRQKLQVSVESVLEEEILPMSSWDQASEIAFNVYGDPESFIDPASLRIVTESRVVLAGNGGSILPGRAGPYYAPIANAGCSMFEKIAVRLGSSTQISGLDSLYPYLSYLENVFKTPKEIKNQVNFPYLLYPDSEVFFDRFDEDRNKGYASRHNACNGSRSMFTSVPLFSPITSQEKLLVPGVDIYVRMVRASSNFILMNQMKDTVKVKRRKTIAATATEAAKEVIEEVDTQVDVNLKIEIVSIKLLVRKYKLTPLLHMDIMNGLRFSPAVYPCKYQQLLEFSRVQGTSVIRETLFTDRILPKTVYLFIIETRRRLGNFTLNPWFIQWPDVSEIKLVSGGEMFPSIPYKPYHIAHDTVDLYNGMLHVTDSLKPGHSNGINMGMYLQGFGVIAFDLSRSHLSIESKISETPRMSDLQVHINFRTNLTEATSFIFIMESDANIYVRSNTEVTTDFI